ncbi:unnamed protein product [Sphenostylis stenocarpa]|uniref:Uncharacterized protein n=1 Tax=Sphenostylis stenocarpa TaxID=92480 RepID=A0AA86SW45_9FABA|nr:unnamed protein product [Sphenostylis stenocarpa]
MSDMNEWFTDHLLKRLHSSFQPQLHGGAVAISSLLAAFPHAQARTLYASSNLPFLSLFTSTFHMGFVR